jgi:hypothetical protein
LKDERSCRETHSGRGGTAGCGVSIPSGEIAVNGGNVLTPVIFGGLTCIVLRRYEPAARAERMVAGSHLALIKLLNGHNPVDSVGRSAHLNGMELGLHNVFTKMPND